MTINVHVACDDAAYRAVIAEFLGHQQGMKVVSASATGTIGEACVEVAEPDGAFGGLPDSSERFRQNVVKDVGFRFAQLLVELLGFGFELLALVGVRRGDLALRFF